MDGLVIPPPDEETRSRLLDSITRFFEDELDQEIGELKSRLVLDFCWRKIAPAAYNQGVADSQAWMAERVADLEGSVHASEEPDGA